MLSLEGGIGILHKNSGDFVYCYICESNPHPVKDTLLSDHYAIVDSKNRKVQVYDHNFNESYVFSIDTIAGSINILGFFYEKILFNPTTITSGFINTLTTETVLGLANCQCVHVTSTPCTPTGSDNNAPCDAGGLGSSACSIGSGSSINVQGVGSGAGGSASSSCSVSCDSAAGFYACCYNN